MREAIERDADAQRAALAGEGDRARVAFRAAAELYRASWDAAPPGSYGRLVGMLKSALLAGDGYEEECAEYARAALGTGDPGSVTAAYAQALAAMILHDDESGCEWALQMRGGSDAFCRTADALVALADRDAAAFSHALEAIVADFAARSEHLTGVAIADTALMLERLAARCGLSASVTSPLLPRTYRT